MSDERGTLVAVDLGASSGRVIAGRLENGRLVTEETGRFANRPVTTTVQGRQRLQWDVLGLWAGIQDGLAVAAQKHGPVRSVGIDTWAVDYGLLDEDGDLLGNPVHYRDSRTAGAVEALAAFLPPHRHYAATGTQVQPFNTVYQLVSAAGSGALRAADRLLMIPDLLGHWMTGVTSCEVTNASSTGMLDPSTRSWSAEVLAALSQAGVPAAARLFGPLVEPGTVIGPLLPDVAASLGLHGTRLVAVGSHDTASAVAAVPMDAKSAAYISSGTWSLVGLELDAPIRSEASRAANFTNELGVDGTVRYLRNVAGLWLLQESMRTWRASGQNHDVATLLAAAAQQAPLRTVIDVDASELAAPGDMPARIAEAARRSGQPVPESPAQITRCILDSLALAYRRAIRLAVDLSGHPVEVVHVVGGGARNALLCQLTADATGLPVVAGPAEGTAVGNLLTQALALGELSGGLAEAREVVRASTELVTHHPGGSEQPWAQAENRLRP